MTNVFICFPILVIGLVNVFAVKISKKSFGIILPFTIMAMALIEYLSQMILGSFVYSYVLIGVLTVLGITVLILGRKDKGLIERINSMGLGGFLVICLFFLLFDFQRNFSTWDEFSHWGKMVKEMLRLDSFYAVPEASLLIHKDYPPFVTLFELFWCKFSGGYSEAGLTLAIHVFEFSIIVPYLLDRYRNRKAVCGEIDICDDAIDRGSDKGEVKWKKSVGRAFSCGLLIGICILTVLLFDTKDLLPTVYLDIVVPILYAVGILVVIESDKAYQFCCLLLVQTAILLTKQIGIAFCMLIWLMYTMKLFMDNWTDSKLVAVVKKMLMSLGVIGLPYLISCTWTSYVDRFGIKGQFELSQIKLSDVINIVQGNDSTYRQGVFDSYLYEIVHNFVGAGRLRIPYFGATLLIVLALAIVYLVFAKKITKECIFLCINVIVGSIGYAFTMLMLYLFCFSEYEATNLASFSRYVGTYIMAECLVLMIVIVKLVSEKKDEKFALRFGLAAMALLFVMSDGTRLIVMARKNYSYDPGYDCRLMADMIEDKLGDGESVICASTNNTTNVYFINYYLNNTVMDENFLYTDISSLTVDDYNWPLVKESLVQNRYLYVVEATEELNDSLGYMVENSKFADKTLYEYKTVEDEEYLVEME